MGRVERPVASDGADSELARIERVEHADARGDVYSVSVLGELDISNVHQLRDAAMQIPNAALGLVVDLTRATFIDSATIGLLFELRQGLGRRSQALRVVCPPGSPSERVLELMSFDAPTRCEGTAEEAIGAIRREMPLHT
jgi:anti-anti-sigma factor